MFWQIIVFEAFVLASWFGLTIYFNNQDDHTDLDIYRKAIEYIGPELAKKCAYGTIYSSHGSPGSVRTCVFHLYVQWRAAEVIFFFLMASAFVVWLLG